MTDSVALSCEAKAAGADQQFGVALPLSQGDPPFPLQPCLPAARAEPAAVQDQRGLGVERDRTRAVAASGSASLCRNSIPHAVRRLRLPVVAVFEFVRSLTTCTVDCVVFIADRCFVCARGQAAVRTGFAPAAQRCGAPAQPSFIPPCIPSERQASGRCTIVSSSRERRDL
jgi:hypothetical protein